jgi:copper transport protein
MRSPRSRSPQFIVIALLAAVLSVLTGLASTRHVSAHAELDRATPGQGEVLAAPPSSVELWFTEPVNADNGSLTVTLRTQANDAIASSSLTVDSADPLHVTATFGGLGFETYTVVWTNQSATDGHQINGSYSFRVGGGPTPGAATTEGGSPALWAVVTRWLTFFGLAIAAGGFFVARMLLAQGSGISGSGRGAIAVTTTPAPRSLRRLTLAGATAALLGTIAEVPLQWLFPPAGAAPASLANVMRGLPDAWWFRPAGAALATGLAVAWLLLRRTPPMPIGVGIVAGSSIPVPTARRAASQAARTNPLIETLGLLAALTALLGLALTGHSAAQQGVWHVPAIASNILHQFAAALWAGGLVALAVVRWSSPRDGLTGTDPIRRFSPWALVLFGIAVTTGVINAGIILPSVSSLWDSRYGVTILVKTIFVLGALGLATWHRRALAQSAAWASGRLRQSLRLEAILVALVVVAASTLALTSPPSGNALTRDPLLGNLTLLEQAHASDGTVVGMLRLEADPLRSNATNTFHVTAAAVDNAPVVIPDGSRVFLDFASVVDGAIAQPRLELTPDGQGGYAGQGDQLSIDLWWQITATVRVAGQEDQIAAFYLLLPDPNLYGADAVDTPDSDPAAEALYQRAYGLTAGATSYENYQSISSADGTGIFEAETVIAAAGDQPTGYELALQSYGTAGAALNPLTIQRQIGNDSWRSTDAGATWISTFTVSGALSPTDILEQYDGATGFQLGAERTVNGELSRAVIFAVPANRYSPTWYVWWVGEQSGLRHQELMITGGHYMTRIFTAYDSGVTVAPPDPATVVNAPR